MMRTLVMKAGAWWSDAGQGERAIVKRQVTVAVMIALMAAMLPAGRARAATITFDNAGTPGIFLGQDCCDAAGLDLSFRGVASIGNGATTLPSLTFWRSGVAGYSYGDLGDVAYVGVGAAAGEIRFDVLGSNRLTLNSIDFGSAQNVARASQVNVFDLSFNLLFSSSFTVPAAGHATIMLGGLSNTAGLILQFGPDGYEVAIDNIGYDLGPVTAGVPEPASWALLITGFGLVAAAARRRRLASVAG
jgi:hypothetical protein